MSLAEEAVAGLLRRKLPARCLTSIEFNLFTVDGLFRDRSVILSTRLAIRDIFASVKAAFFAAFVVLRGLAALGAAGLAACSVFFLPAAFGAAAAFAFPIFPAAAGLRFTLPAIAPLGLAVAAFVVCVARLLPAAVFSRPPRAVAPVPPLAKRPRLSRE
jgi:hypothetical protein